MHKRFYPCILLILFTLCLSINNTVLAAANAKLDFYKLGNYILPDSSKVLLAEKDLFDLSMYQLDYARNEIYARHGYIFKNEIYSSYFSDKSWYKRNPNFKESMLSNIEKKNAEFLFAYTSKLKANFKKIDGSQYTIDLNGDGKKDKIKLNCKPGDSEYGLTVNNSTVSGTGDNLDGVMYISDIDKKDKYKEIALTESGPSSDYNTYFYYYNGSKLIFMGKVQGSDFTIKANGSGRFITKTRGTMLQTWFYSDEYKLSVSHTLSHITEKYRRMNTIVTLKKQLKLQKSPTDTATAVTLKAGEKVLLTDTDDKKWCAAESASGVKGWFSVEDGWKINGYLATEYFDGLCMAD